MWKVGELAKATGVSVRTLHHYEQIGLMKAAGRTAAGHRLYGDEQVRRLRHIRSLVSIGLPLGDIANLLRRPDDSPERSLEAQRESIHGRIKRLQGLLRRLESLNGASSTTELIEAIKEMEMTEKFEKYYTPEQLKTLAKRAGALGDEGMLQAQNDWQKVFEGLRAARREGLAPTHPRVLALARESQRLIQAFTGGDPGIHQSLSNMYRQDEGMRNEYLPEPELMEYMAAAAALEKNAK